jgi:hypothetical protein
VSYFIFKVRWTFYEIEKVFKGSRTQPLTYSIYPAILKEKHDVFIDNFTDVG